VKPWRPENWEETVKPHIPLHELELDITNDALEAGADAMYEAVMDAFPSDIEIRLRVIDVQFGGLSVPDFVEWLKGKLR